MHNLTQSNPDKLTLKRSTTATLDVVTSWADNSSGTITEGVEVHAFSTAATGDILATPGSGKVRKCKEMTVRNKDASNACDVTVIFNSNSVEYEMVKVTLYPGYTLEYVEGVGFYVLQGTSPSLSNESATSQSGFAADTYLVGSNISIPSSLPVVGTAYKLSFDVTKTNVGTATPIITIRFGTAGTTGDTSRCSFTFGAGSAAVDTANVEILCVFRTVGSGTAAVIQGKAFCQNILASTGWTTVVKSVVTTGGGFDSTVANSIIGASYNGGASAVHTIQLVRAVLEA